MLFLLIDHKTNFFDETFQGYSAKFFNGQLLKSQHWFNGLKYNFLLVKYAPRNNEQSTR